jgi:hypothetical protein
VAQTWDKFRDTAKLAQKYADLINEARLVGRVLLETHDGIDFTAAAGTDPVPSWVLKSPDGNLKGFTFSPADYLAFVAFTREVEKLMANQQIDPGFYNTRVAAVLSPDQGG